MAGESIKGHLDLLVLAVLADGPRHGYSIIEELRLRSDEVFDLAEGTIYPVLHRLERAGDLESAWNVTGGRRRRTYRLTTTGRAKLVDERLTWNQFSAAVAAVLKAGPWPTTP